MHRSGEIIFGSAGKILSVERIAEPAEYCEQIVLTQEIKRRQRVGLFDHLIFVDGVTSSIEQPVDAATRCAVAKTTGIERF